MKKLDGTITLSILEEDNTQRVIFRIIPLCTKDGLIFHNQKTSYPDCGSLRVVPDKREQSSFKDRMRDIGRLCCVQLSSEGKELTKVRQNRNYDPNQGECNQYAIYSDVICGFEENAVFEVFLEDQDHSRALTENVLFQRGKMLLGPLARDAALQWDELKPFGNEEYLMHSVEDLDGNQRIFYWNPGALITWRQRKKNIKRGDTPVRKTDRLPSESISVPIVSDKPANDPIPIGTRLDILDETRTNEEHITEMNLPVSDDANRLDSGEKPRNEDISTTEIPHYHGTPIAETPKNDARDRNNGGAMQGVVERQLHEQQRGAVTMKTDRKPVENPVEMLRTALQNAWNIPAMHQELFQLLGENNEILQYMMQSSMIDGRTKCAYSATKAELDAIEGERIALLIELDKVKENYQQIKEKMYQELARQKQNDIARLENHIEKLQKEKQTLEDILSEMGDRVQGGTMELFAKHGNLEIVSNGSDITLSPTIGYLIDPRELVENIRCSMSHMGFLCKQDCVTEFMIILSLYDEFFVLAPSLWEAEHYIKNMLRVLGLQNVSAWPSVFGAMHIASILPENDLRTPTVEIIRNNRTPVRAFGHKTMRLIDSNNLPEASSLPIVRIPELNKERSLDKLNESGKPISLQTIQQFTSSANMLYRDGEVWFDNLEKKLNAEGVEIQGDVYYAMRVFARITTPQVVGGFNEAADAAVLAWVVPALIRSKYPKERLDDLIGGLSRSMDAMKRESY